MIPANPIWIFSGPRLSPATGAFDDLDMAEAWIKQHQLSGMLTAYPRNQGCYDWAVREELVGTSVMKKYSPEYVAKFTSAMQEHHHYENGQRIS